MSTPIPSNTARTTPWGVAAATDGTLLRPPADGRFGVGLTTDSRAATPDCVFVALRGPSHDGHAYVQAAIQAGASLVVVERGKGAGVTGADVVEVEDTLVAWGRLARAHLRAWRRARPTGEPARVVAITGSAGKTTTKELCAAILGSVGPCHSTRGNLNNRVGVPAVAFGVEASHRFVVFEVGMSMPGEIQELADIVEPDVAVLLNVGVAHAGGVGGGRADVAREKGALFAALNRRACAVVNLEDAAAHAQLARTKAARAETFGTTEDASYWLVERVPEGTGGSRLVIDRPTMALPTRERMELRLPLVGEMAAVDLLAALAAADAACATPIPAALVAAAVAGVGGVAGRAALRRLDDDILVIDDSYNANPASMAAALATLSEVSKAEGRRAVAVLGEMKELGPLAAVEHEKLGDALVAARVSLTIGCGGLIDRALDRARAGGLEVVRAASTEEGATVATKRVAPRDVVLLKGSRAAALERVLDALVRVHGVAQAEKAGAG